MSNYSDNPSMEEILERIKKALADREHRMEMINSEKNSNQSVITAEEEIAEMATFSTLSVNQTQSKNQNITNENNNTIENDEIFIKPNLSSTQQSDVYILSKNMKVSSAEKFSEIDFPKLFKELASTMSKDLAIAYMAPKIESWLNLNFAQISSNCRKK